MDGDAGLTAVDWETGSIYSADSGVDRHHLIFISSYNTMKVHTLSFQTFDLTCCFRNFADPCNCVDPQCQVVSYLLTPVLHSSRQNHSFTWIPFGCQDGCNRVLMVGSLSSSSVVSPQMPTSGASWSSLTVCFQAVLWLCSITICGQFGCMYIEREI